MGELTGYIIDIEREKKKLLRENTKEELAIIIIEMMADIQNKQEQESSIIS